MKLLLLLSFSLSNLFASSILLVSIDGYRHDYNEIYSPPFLSSFAKDSARLESLIPSFPTKTYPNHLSLVTGRYPINHGIVSNYFFEPSFEGTYKLKDRSSVKDSRFYKAGPIWNLVEKNGLKSAPYFWPGSETAIYGIRPSSWEEYNHSATHDEKVNKVIKYFSLANELRPDFVTLYFHDVDSAGHKYGPRSSQTKEAIMAVDRSLNKLITKLKEIQPDLNIIIVSDHGMTSLNPDRVEELSKNSEVEKILSSFKAVGEGTMIHLYKKRETNIGLAIKHLNKGSKNYSCYPNSSIPKELNYRNRPEIGDIVCLAEKGWSIFVDKKEFQKLGAHGYSNKGHKDMHGILYAKGPAFKNVELPSKKNIHLYPLMAKILNLEFDHEIDGELSELEGLLK